MQNRASAPAFLLGDVNSFRRIGVTIGLAIAPLLQSRSFLKGVFSHD